MGTICSFGPSVAGPSPDETDGKADTKGPDGRKNVLKRGAKQTNCRGIEAFSPLTFRTASPEIIAVAVQFSADI